MTANLLCPGPSLALATVGPADMTIAVNRAAIAFASDAWVCRDWVCGETTPPGGILHWQAEVIGSPVLVSGRDSIEAITRHGRPWRGRTCAIDDLMASWPGSWTLYSATAALVYAASRGARRVHVWGADMSGTSDWDGREAGRTRDADRWRREAEIWRTTIQATGLIVIRH